MFSLWFLVSLVQNALLEFERVLKAKQQVVAGKLYHLTLEAIDGGKKKVYEAKVWVKPWMNFKQLQEFKASPWWISRYWSAPWAKSGRESFWLKFTMYSLYVQ